MEALKKRRSVIKGQMTKILTFAESIQSTTSHEEIKARLERTNNLWTEFAKVGAEMFVVNADTDSQTDAFDESYYRAVALLNASIRNFQANPMNTTVQALDGSFQLSAIETKLPRLNIPIFQGDFQDWQSFFDLFNSSVHEKVSITAAQKLQYLKSLLRGEPLGLIKHLSITDANYIEAYQILSKRYDKKKTTINRYIETFFNQPVITRINSSNIRKLANTTEEIIRGLKAVGPQGELRDPWLVYIITHKLDDESRQYWQHESSKIEHPSIQDLIECLLLRADTLEGIGETSTKTAIRTISNIRRTHVTTSQYTINCPLCNTEHMLYQCTKFKDMSIAERRSYIKENSRCYNCLSDNHTVLSCRSKRSCQICRKRHNSLLHCPNVSNTAQTASQRNVTVQSATTTNIPPPKVASINIPPTTINSSINIPQPSTIPSINTLPKEPISSINIPYTNDQQPIITATTTNQIARLNAPTSQPITSYSQSLLPTALIHVKDLSGNMQTCRALLDSGSQASFVTEACAKRLSLPVQRANITILGVGSSTAGTSKGSINLNICSRFEPKYQITIKALILPKVAMPLPTSSFHPRVWSHIQHLPLADPHFNKSSPIDILIGAEHFFDIVKDGKIYGDAGLPVAQNSIFGWIIAGNVHESKTQCASTLSLLTEIDINETLQQFWETEEIPSTKNLTADEQLCENHFEETHTRASDGRFVVRLPFKQSNCELGNSLNTAIRRFLSLEHKLQRDPVLRDSYITFMREYISLGHMVRIPIDEVNIEPRLSFYLPHHAVIKQSSTTTKLRVVFDASAKTSTNISLNDTLLVGPTVQHSLYSILLRFRKHLIVFTADIEKMYRQVDVHRADTNYQRIVWRETQSSPIEHYRLLTVTYGTASAPYLATKPLIKLADEYQEQYPIASQIVRTDLYIDDLMSGAKNEHDAHALKDQLISIFESGGFNLRKWTSNSRPLLETIPLNNQELTPMEIHDGPRSVKLLGLEWNPQTDTFHFKVCIDPKPTTTKREMLSEASKIFDPIGWLSPSTVMVKIMFQSLWLLNLQWDDQLPSAINKKWITLRDDFMEIMKLSIPRCLHTEENDFQLHGFSDASEHAYSAVIYTRVKKKNGTYETNIVSAKTKVTPIKQVSIPRLELCAALLLTRLMKMVTTSLQCPNVDVFYWTDSFNVLWWLSSHPRTWKTYVANRTSKILETTSRRNWQYVPTKENPADCASRGILPSLLINFDLWWQGATWLRQDKEMWPDQGNLQYTVDQSEKRPNQINHYHAVVENEFLSELAKSYSKFSKLVEEKRTERKSLVTEGLQDCAGCIIKWAQTESFAIEIKNIHGEKPLPKSSKLLSLNPFLDERGLLRVGSRIRNANIQYDTKFPIILPANHITTELIIDETHVKYLHASQSSMISTLRQRFWIVNCKSLVRQRIHKCISCTRYRATKLNQLMGDLPPERVNYKYTFYQTGVDYAGPIWLKAITGRKSIPHKAYIAIFVCLSTKAVHIELVSNLTTEAFIAALKRFMSRRGVCADMFSDNGTNFVGAKNAFVEIQKLNKSLKHNKLISNFLLESNTTWHFIPPSAPSFGGLWEAAVKSTKYHIRRVLGSTVLNFEEMTTFLAQIEAILNSRPLCLLSPEEDALTPAHFIIGQPLTMLPDFDYKPIVQNRLSRWQLIQHLMQHFWARWHNEYLTSLHNRSKWQRKQPNLKIDDIVLIRDENSSPASWPLGKIIETHPGKDGVVRVVSLRTKAGIIKRPILKLVLLPVS